MKVRSKKEVINEARTMGAKVHFASLMDICHLKNAELQVKHQKYKGRVVFRGDIVKEESGSYAVFTEQGSSASQVTAAKVMDIISRLPGCAGQAADAVSAYTQIKMEDAPKLLKIPKSECPDIWIRLPRHKWPKSWSSMEDPVVPLERNLYGHPLAGTVMGKAMWEHPFEVRFGNAYSYTVKKGLFLCKKLAGKKQNIDPMWKVLNKEVDLGEPTSFLDHVYLECTPRQCEVSKDIFDNYGKYSNFFVVLRSGGSCQKKCGTILWAGKQDDSTTLQSINSMHWWHHFKEENWNPWEDCQKYALKLFWNAYIWHVLEDLIFHGQWTNLHDRSQNGPKLVTNAWIVWSLTFIIHVSTNSVAMWETLPNNADWDCFKTPNLQEILRIPNLHQVEHCAFLEVIHLFQSVGCVRHKFQFRTVQQNPKSSLWTLDWGWTGFPLSIYGIWLF